MWKIAEVSSGVLRFMKTGVWRMRLTDLSGRRSFFIRLVRILVLAVRGYLADRCGLRAASLTFYSMLSVVPAVAMAFGIAKGFGFERMLKNQIERAFPAQEEIRERIMEFSTSLIQDTQGGMIAGIGVIVLFYTVLKVLNSMEVSFNDIWQVRKARSFVRKFTDYFSILLIAPVLVAMAGSLTITLHTQLERLTRSVALLQYISSPLFFLVRTIPYGLVWILFTLVYIIIPNTKVRIPSALIAGVAAGTAYQITQWAYINFQVGVSKYNAVYGSFAALPLFLIWLHLSWLFVMFGAELAFAIQNVDRYEYEPDYLRISPHSEKLLSLKTAYLVIRNFSQGHSPLGAPAISDLLSIPLPVAQDTLRALSEGGVLSEFRTDEGEDPVYVPSRDIHALTVSGVLSALEHRGVDDLPVSKSPEWKRLDEILHTFEEIAGTSRADRLLKDI
jgi:membrane protein